MRIDVFRVEDGAIVDGYGAILYDADCLSGLSRQTIERLAELHSYDASLDWEHAADILVEEGLMRAEE